MQKLEGESSQSSGGSPIAVALRNITKRFPGVVANDGIELTVRAGTIHAIVGENGAGKSTLMKILYGQQRPDEGTITVNGEQVSFRSPKDAIARGIGMVHQHFMLADNLTVAENVALGAEPSRRGVLDIGAAARRISDLATTYGLDVDPNEMVETLGVGERQRVEILKVLYRGARILILDEPTAVLVPQEVNELFVSLRGLVAEGNTVIFISHKLDEVLRVADDITVVRAGRTVAQRQPAEVTAHQLAELMVGSELPSPTTEGSTVTETVQLRLRNVTVAGAGAQPVVDHVSLDIHCGEIVGIAGVEGNGQRELVEAIMAIVESTGTFELSGSDISRWHTRQRREAGLGYIPEDRHHDGLMLSQPLWENSMLGHQTSEVNSGRFGWLRIGGARKRTAQIVKDFDVRTPGIDVAALALSGGNQQKLIVGRELLAEPQVLLAAHPTRGIDVGAQAAVWEQLRHARSAGLGVLLISADLEELIGLSDTLLVMLRGAIVAKLDPRSVTSTELGSYMTGAKQAEAPVLA
jgi:general nucleoside transport system ATP-binding protein